jgi:coiled-coil domain-containing protein 55
MSRAQRKLQEEALKLDQTVFEYDEVWDGMQNAREKVKEAKESEAGKRDVSAVDKVDWFSPPADQPMQPKYIGAFLKSAETRRLDRLRAEEKMLQHERDKEGEEFADKEKFMTTAYKKQLEEVRQAEAEEKKREGEFWHG